MRRRTILLLIVGAVLVMTVGASAQYANPKLVIGSKHDFSSTGGGTYKSSTFTEVCAYCHVSHQVVAAGKQYPLWNHQLSTNATYNKYSSPTFNALNTNIQDIGLATAGAATTSHLCLSCHDGTVAVNTIYVNPEDGTQTVPNFTGGNGGKVIGVTMLGTDMSSTHPVNFDYTKAQSGTGNPYIKPVNTSTSAVGTAPNALPLYPGGSGTNTFTYSVQCSSCHTSHDNTNTKFLRISNAQSAMCVVCHTN